MSLLTTRESNDFTGWRIRPVVDARGRLVFFHGYGQSSRTLLGLGAVLADNGWDCVLPDLPGHGRHPSLLEATQLLKWATRLCATILPTRLAGFSLGARLAEALAKDNSSYATLQISPPMHSDFDGAARDEILRTLKPRWVRESGPMKDLKAALESLPLAEPGASRLVLTAARDLPSVREGEPRWQEAAHTRWVRIPHCEHASILDSPQLESEVLAWAQT